MYLKEGKLSFKNESNRKTKTLQSKQKRIVATGSMQIRN